MTNYSYFLSNATIKLNCFMLKRTLLTMSIILYQKTLITVGMCDVRMKNVSIPLTATRQWNRKLIAHSCGWKGDQDADTIFRTKKIK